MSLPAYHITTDADEAIYHLDQPLAYELIRPHILPTRAKILFLGGFQSSMDGKKACQLAAWAQTHEWHFCRFDYRGHGRSGGDFSKLTLHDWLDDAEQMLLHCFGESKGELILVGSSMGAWFAYHLAMRHPSIVAGIITIAAAPDFVTRHLLPNLSSAQRDALESNQVCYADQLFSPCYLHQPFFASGTQLALLESETSHPIDCPIRALHGLDDDIAPWQNSVEMASKVRSADYSVELIKGGDHSLSKPQDLQRLFITIEQMAHDITQ